MRVLYLDDDQLSHLGITTSAAVAAIEKTLLGIRANTISVAAKSGVTTPDGRYLMTTLSASDELGLVAVKSVVSNARNKSQQLPGIDGGIMLLDSETGQLRAILAANWITSVRTAAMSAVAAKRLANPQSQSIGLIGAGVQAESHLRAMAALFPLQRVLVSGRGKPGVKRIHLVAQELGLLCEKQEPAVCLAQSDIIVSSVTRDFSIEPFLDARFLPSGSFATMPDLAIPWQPKGLTSIGRIYIDDLAQERSMDKPMIELDTVTGELADLVIDDVTYDSASSAAFVFRGTAAGDLAVAGLAYQRATTAGT